MKTYQITVEKEGPAAHFGLTLAQKIGSSQIIIKNISPSGVFSKTDLLPGLQLMDINGQSVVNKTVKDAIIALESAPVGDVVVTARGHVATAKKKDTNTKIGLALQKLTGKDDDARFSELVIVNVAQTGIFAGLGLQPGYRISYINGKECPQTLKEAIRMIRDAVGELTVVAVESEKKVAGAVFDSEYGGEESSAQNYFNGNGKAYVPEEESTIESNPADAFEGILNTAPSEEEYLFDLESGEGQPFASNHTKVVTTIISKRVPGEKVGLALRNVKKSKSVIVNRLVDGGLAKRSKTPLSLGQTILFINGQKCPPSAKRATALVTEAPRTITIIARNTEVAAYKQSVDTKLGIVLRSSPKRSTRVSVESVDPGGLFGDSILRKGQTVVAINGIDCPDNALKAIGILKAAVDDISIVVGTRRRRSRVGQGVDSVPPIVNTLQESKSRSKPEAVSDPELKTKSISIAELELHGTRSIVSKKESGKWIGISFSKTEEMIVVRKIEDDSPLANSGLKLGDAIVGVNNEACPESITELISLVYRTSGDMVITSSSVEEGGKTLALLRNNYNTLDTIETDVSTLPPGRVRVMIVKSEEEEKIGIRVVRSLQERIIVSSIREGSLLSKTGLAPGQLILSINGIPCPSTKDATVQLIKDTVGPLEIIAFSSVGQGIKATASTTVGITLSRTKSNEIIISEIKKGSLLDNDFEWALREGQLVISINGIPCPTTVRDAIAIIRACEGKLTIVAVDRVKQNSLANSEAQVSFETVPSVLSPQNKSKRNIPGRNESPLTLPDPVFSNHMNLTKEPQNESTPDSKKNLFVERLQRGSATEFKKIQVIAHNKRASDMQGLSFGVTQDNVFVNHISANSPFVDTDLCVGHRIAQIDGENCPSSLADAMELFAQHVGTMILDVKETIVSPGQVSASIMKQSENIDPGLRFGESYQGRVFISKIDHIGLFAGSALQVGQVVRSINGRHCLNSEMMHDMLMSATGKVTIIASRTVARAMKDSIDQFIGILLQHSTNGDNIVVKHVSTNGIFGKSDLKVGQRVLSIAGVECPTCLVEAEGILQDCVGEVHIVAVDTPVANSFAFTGNGNGCTQAMNSHVRVAVYKESQHSRIGMKMRKGQQKGRVVVSGISDNGPVAEKGLELGMYIVSIDGKPCPPDPKTATERIKETSGHFTILASPTVASVTKKTRDEKLGVLLSRTQDLQDILVHKIADHSAFKGTDLQVGQRVISINGKKCSGLLDDAIRTLADCVGPVTIVSLDPIK